MTESDIDDYAALKADPEVMRFLGEKDGPWDWGRSWRHLAFLIGHWRLAGVGSWAVELRETGAFLGVIGYTGPGCGWPGFELAWALGNDASVRVAERLGESLQGRVDLMGRELLCYGIDRETFLRYQERPEEEVRRRLDILTL